MTFDNTAHRRWWTRIDEDLEGIPLALQLTRQEYLCSSDYTVYLARFSSADHYRVSAYLSIPTGSHPHSALIELPARYGSVVQVPHPNDRLRHVVLTLIHRGLRLSDFPTRGSFPGFFTRNIEDSERYIFRGVMADCLRTIEVVQQLEMVDQDRVGAVGDDSTVVVAARRGGLAAIRVDSLRFTSAWSRRRATDSYPLEELNELERRDPEAAILAERTLELLDPAVALAGDVEVPALVTVPSNTDHAPYDRLAHELGDQAQIFETTHFDYEHHDARDRWISTLLEVEPMTRFKPTAGMRGRFDGDDL